MRGAAGIVGALVIAGLVALGGWLTTGPPGQTHRTPVIEQLSTEDDIGPEEVVAGVYVSNIQSINLSDNSFDADFYLWLRWRDPGLDPTAGVEVMNPYQASALVVTPVYPEPQRQPDGSLLWLARYQGSFNSPLSLSDYPFEQQTLRIIVEDGVGTTRHVVYRPDSDPIALDPEVTLPGYHIGEPRIDFSEFAYESSFGEVGSTPEHRTYPRITVSIPLSSPAASGIVKTMLPIAIVLIAAALALLIPVEYVDAKIGLGITALLALVAMHWGVSSTLPDASYLLMIDVLYLLSYAAVTAVLAVTVAGVWVTQTRGEQAATDLERRALVVIGVALAVALALVLFLYLPE